MLRFNNEFQSDFDLKNIKSGYGNKLYNKTLITLNFRLLRYQIGYGLGP